MNSVLLFVAGTISIIVFLSTLFYYATTNKVKEGLDTPSPEKLVPIPNTGIPDGYYQYNSQYIAPVPYGYYASTDKTKLFPKTQVNQWSSLVLDSSMASVGKNISSSSSNNKYSNDLSKIMNIQYHQSDTEIMKKNNGMDISFGQTWIYDMCGNKVAYPSTKIQGDIVYYTPGSYTFGASNYVPSYEATSYLSKLTGRNTTGIYRPDNKSGGFCTFNKNSPNNLEQSCRKLDVNTCASTDCCVLLGGSTCVAGDQYGPTQKANYGDVFIRNKDYYYYRGKCFGNCV
jgi:hypothetical protein